MKKIGIIFLNGRMVAILSIWDVYYTDASGRQRYVRATKESASNLYLYENFTGEGNGTHMLINYNWKAGHWYKMLLQCGVSTTTGNTTLLFWVCDMATNTWTNLCTYDLGIKDVAMKDNMAVFLECFNVEHAGEVRSLECKEAVVHDIESNSWIRLNTGVFSENYEYPGSYSFGTDNNIWYMITSGLPNRASQR